MMGYIFALLVIFLVGVMVGELTLADREWIKYMATIIGHTGQPLTWDTGMYG